MGADCFSSNRHALEDRTRVGREKNPVFIRSRLSLIGVTDDVSRWVRCVGGKLHLAIGRESRTAASTKSGGADHIDNRFTVHRKCFFQRFKSAAVRILL